MTMAAPPKNPQSPANPSPPISDHPQTHNNGVIVSEYEQFREERIKQNIEKMQKLGIFDLSLQLKLKSATPVSYSEVDLAKKDKELGDYEGVVAEVGSKPEVYTEEHEKLLGNTEKSWTLFVDGYGRDGKRIYDSFKGKTCHQCRQKTLGYRTHCSNCNMVQGQFCGDCLYMRQAKGWAPTGALYKKVSRLGFKSVAHYLIQTHRLETKMGNNRDTTNEVSVKRSLPFSDMVVLSEDSLDVTNGEPGSPKLLKDKTDDESKTNNGNLNSAKRLLPFMNMREDCEIIGSLEVDHKVDDLLGSSKHQHQNGKEDRCQSQKDKESNELECGNSVILLKGFADLVTVSRVEGIADDDFLEADKKALDTKPAVNEISLEKEIGEENDTPKVKEETSTGITVINLDDNSPSAEEKISDVKQVVEGEEEKEELPSDVQQHGNVNTPLQRSPKLKRKRVEPSLDSIGGRVRSRLRMGNSHNDDLQGLSVKENLNQKPAAKRPSKLTSSQPSSESIAGRLRSRRKST
ncbi:hypothetical protein TIFTF001_002599 [Ficus carica]|uniref:Zinc-finger domain-containing protein n=1 Tax=Ficus carica TaxID=3494 RepID=A0AA87ZBL1_FICCA|nr:hypothetical protein TIFTF001_002599 [Ficus carica]